MNKEDKPGILILYPHDHTQKKMGIDARYNELIGYLSGAGFRIDQLGLKNFVSSWENGSGHDPRIDRLYLYDQKDIKFSAGTRGAGDKITFEKIPDYTDGNFREYFINLVINGGYKYILISYIYWAELINDHRLKNIWKILDLSDFTTLILKGLSTEKIDVGSFIDEEIKRINLFDDVISISSDEMWFFSQFAKNPNYYYIPHFIDKKANETTKEYDLLFIGSDNEFNKAGIKWFFDKVYPFLNPGINILITGKITTTIGEYKNVTKIKFVEDLDDIYLKSKILIAPMFGGTGLKIKVVEALSYQIPVVTTSKGIIGFRGKKGNGCLVADNAEEFILNIENLLNSRSFYKKISNYAEIYFANNFEKSIVLKTLNKVFQRK